LSKRIPTGTIQRLALSVSVGVVTRATGYGCFQGIWDVSWTTFCLGASQFLGPAAPVVSVLVALLAIWALVRAWRVGLRVDDIGITVRNLLRTYEGFRIAD
jgi:hypothetical protein